MYNTIEKLEAFYTSFSLITNFVLSLTTLMKSCYQFNSIVHCTITCNNSIRKIQSSSSEKSSGKWFVPEVCFSFSRRPTLTSSSLHWSSTAFSESNLASRLIPSSFVTVSTTSFCNSESSEISLNNQFCSENS